MDIPFAFCSYGAVSWAPYLLISSFINVHRFRSDVILVKFLRLPRLVVHWSYPFYHCWFIIRAFTWDAVDHTF